MKSDYQVPYIIHLPQPKPAQQVVPYPDAKAPNPMPAIASGPESDCSGLIELPPGPVRIGTWTIGEGEPMFFFNTKQDAQDCAGDARQLTSEGWK